MLFCPKCGSLLKPKDEKGKKIMACSCGFKSDEKLELIKETVKKEGPELAVIEEEAEIYPLVDEKCPKCGHGQARTWEIQTRASDEPATKFFKCEKCKHIWRDYK